MATAAGGRMPLRLRVRDVFDMVFSTSGLFLAGFLIFESSTVLVFFFFIRVSVTIRVVFVAGSFRSFSMDLVGSGSAHDATCATSSSGAESFWVHWRFWLNTETVRLNVR